MPALLDEMRKELRMWKNRLHPLRGKESLVDLYNELEQRFVDSLTDTLRGAGRGLKNVEYLAQSGELKFEGGSINVHDLLDEVFLAINDELPY